MSEPTSSVGSAVPITSAPTLATPSMFTTSPESYLHGGPSVPTGYKSLSGTFSGTSSRPWTLPMSSSGVLTGSPIVSTERLDSLHTSSGQYQVGPFGSIPLSTISTGLPAFGENYFPSYYSPHARGQHLVTQYENTPSLFGQTNVYMNVCQWQPTLPIQPQTVVHSYQPVQPVTPTSLPLVNTSIPLLQNQNIVHQPYQASSSTEYHQILGPRNPNPLVNLQPPISGIIYS